MDQSILEKSTAGDDALLELGFAMGQSYTFGLVAGRCTAAHAQAIRHVREEKLYKERCEKWEDFCPRYLKMCRAEADRIIRLLDEFGPVYFELSQLTRISAATFRAIAPAVSDGVLHHKGEAIEIIPENSQKVAAAVAEMRSALPKAERAAEEPDTLRRIQTLSSRCAESLAELGKLSRDENLGAMRFHLRNELTRLRDQMLRIAA